MSELKSNYTSGPWEWGMINQECGTVLVGIDLDDAEGFSIAEVCSGSPVEIERTKADAVLIAAAPDLLDACKMAEGLIINHESGHMPEFQAAQRKLMDAIAKAEGKL